MADCSKDRELLKSMATDVLESAMFDDLGFFRVRVGALQGCCDCIFSGLETICDKQKQKEG